MRWQRLRRLLRRPEPQPDPRFDFGISGSPAALLKAMLGSTSTTGAGPYTHTYTPERGSVLLECGWCGRAIVPGGGIIDDGLWCSEECLALVDTDLN